MPHTKDAIAKTKVNDSHVLKLYYESNKVAEILCEENPSNGEFTSQEYDKILQEAINHVQKAKSYYIPKIAPENIELVEILGGKVISNDELEY